MKRFTVALLLVMALVSIAAPSASAQDGYCYEDPCYHYVGPWVWDTSLPWGGFWRSPEGAIGGIDLRSIPEMSQRGGIPGLGFFVVDRQLGREYTLLSTNLDNAILPARINQIEGTWNINIEAITTRGIIWEMFAEEGDPTGETRWRPVSPGPDGRFTVALGGYSPVVFEKDRYTGRNRGEKMGSWKDTIK